MPDQVIALTLKLKDRGIAGTTSKMVKLKGTVKQLDKALASAAGSGLKGATWMRSGYKKAREELKNAAKNAKNLETGLKAVNVELTNIGRGRAGSTIGKILGGKDFAAERRAKLNAIRRAMREEERLRERMQRQQMQRMAKQRARFSKMMIGTIQTTGFVGIAAASALKTLFDPTKIQGIFGPALGQLGSVIGNLFGETIGSILGDLGKAGGEIAEALLNGITATLRLGARFLGSFFETFFIGVIAAHGTMMVSILVGIVAGLVRAVMETFTAFVKEIVDLFRSLVKAIVAIISAFVKTVVAIFRGIGKIIVGVWKGVWATLKAITKLSVQAILGIVKKLVDQIAVGFKEFVAIQVEAAKTFGLVTDVAGQSTRKFATLAMRLASEFGFAMGDIQKTLFDVTSAGFRTAAKGAKILEKSSILAVAGAASLSGATKAVVSVLRAYSKDASEADLVTRQLFAGQVFARATVDEFASALTNIIPIASSAGVSFEDVTKALATITLSGFSASRASRGLSLLLTGLIAPSGQIRKKFEGIGMSFTEMGKNGQIVLKPLGDIIKQLQKVSIAEIRTVASRIQSRNAVLALKSGYEKYLEISRDFVKVTKQLDAAHKGVTKEFDRQFKILYGNITVLRSLLVGGFARAIQGPFKDLVDMIKEITQWLLKSEAVERFFKAFQKFAQPVIDTIIEPMKKGLDGILTVLKTEDFAKIFETETAEKFREALLKIVEHIKNIPTFLVKIFDTVLDTIEIIKIEAKFIADVISGMFKKLADPETFVKSFDAFANAFMDVISIIGKFLYQTLKDVFLMLVDFFNATIGPKIVDFIDKMVDKVIVELGTSFIGNLPFIGMEDKTFKDALRRKGVREQVGTLEEEIRTGGKEKTRERLEKELGETRRALVKLERSVLKGGWSGLQAHKERKEREAAIEAAKLSVEVAEDQLKAFAIALKNVTDPLGRETAAAKSMMARIAALRATFGPRFRGAAAGVGAAAKAGAGKIGKIVGAGEITGSAQAARATALGQLKANQEKRTQERLQAEAARKEDWARRKAQITTADWIGEMGVPTVYEKGYKEKKPYTTRGGLVGSEAERELRASNKAEFDRLVTIFQNIEKNTRRSAEGAIVQERAAANMVGEMGVPTVYSE